jgi:hypothetical protein
MNPRANHTLEEKEHKKLVIQPYCPQQVSRALKQFAKCWLQAKEATMQA